MYKSSNSSAQLQTTTVRVYNFLTTAKTAFKQRFVPPCICGSTPMPQAFLCVLRDSAFKTHLAVTSTPVYFRPKRFYTEQKPFITIKFLLSWG